MWISQWKRTDSVRESRGGDCTATGAALCGRIACSDRINYIRGRGWGWRCQAYFWECTGLIIGFERVCNKQKTRMKRIENVKRPESVGKQRLLKKEEKTRKV
jgi:hypothetical protein